MSSVDEVNPSKGEVEKSSPLKTSRESLREGYLQKKSKSFFKSGWKEKYFILHGGSLYYYEKATDQAAQGVMQLQNCTITSSVEKNKQVITVKTSDKALFISAKSQEEYEDWFGILTNNIDSPPTPPPDKTHRTKGKSKVASSMIDKAVDFGASRKIIKEFVTDETFIIMGSLKSFVSKFDSVQAAENLETQALQVGVKFALLYKEKKLTKDMLLVTVDPLHKLCDKLIDGYEIPFSFNSKEVVDLAIEIHSYLNKILKPHLNEKSLKSLEALFEYFQNEDLLNDFFEKKKWQETSDLGVTLRELWDLGRL